MCNHDNDAMRAGQRAQATDVQRGLDTTSSRDRLAAAIARADKIAPTLCEDSLRIVEAARKHLATLPNQRWKVTHFDFIRGYYCNWSIDFLEPGLARISAEEALKAGCQRVSVEAYDV